MTIYLHKHITTLKFVARQGLEKDDKLFKRNYCSQIS